MGESPARPDRALLDCQDSGVFVGLLMKIQPSEAFRRVMHQDRFTRNLRENLVFFVSGCRHDRVHKLRGIRSVRSTSKSRA